MIVNTNTDYIAMCCCRLTEWKDNDDHLIREHLQQKLVENIMKCFTLLTCT